MTGDTPDFDDDDIAIMDSIWREAEAEAKARKTD